MQRTSWVLVMRGAQCGRGCWKPRDQWVSPSLALSLMLTLEKMPHPPGETQKEDTLAHDCGGGKAAGFRRKGRRKS